MIWLAAACALLVVGLWLSAWWDGDLELFAPREPVIRDRPAPYDWTKEQAA